MDISIVVPLFNEVESIPELASWIERVMLENKFSYEVIIVNDGSNDGSWDAILKQTQKNPSFKAINFRRNYGKSAALYKGFEAAEGDVVITMDADLQDSPDEIPELYRMVMKDGYDLVSGWKRKRFDPMSKRIPSKLYNATARKITGIKLHDMNCGLKAYRKQVIKSIEVYGEMHRYIPVLAKGAGFKNIAEKVVQHQERKYGVTKFGLERYINGMLDLLSVTFITRFGKKPMHFFGLIGVIAFFIGFTTLGYLSVMKLVYDIYNMTDRPLFFFGLLSIIFGTQLFLTGFLAELVSRTSADRNIYLVDEEINF